MYNKQQGNTTRNNTQTMAATSHAMSADIALLMERHGSEVVAAALKKMTAKPKVKKDTTATVLAKYMDNILSEPKMAKVSLKMFKAMAVEAWNRKHPEGIPKKANAYTEFVKANMQSVRDTHPNNTHEEHMKIMGQLWKKNKFDDVANAESSSTSQSQSSDNSKEPNTNDDEVTNEMVGAQPDDTNVDPTLTLEPIATPKPKARKADKDIAPTPKKSRRSLSPIPSNVLTGCRVTRSSSKQ